MYLEVVHVLVEGLAQPLQLLGSEFLVDVDQCVVEAAALDEVEAQQGFYLVEEHEGAAGSDAGRIFREVVYVGFLASDDAVGEVYHAVYGEMVAGFYIIDRACRLEFKVQGFWDGIVFARRGHGAHSHAHKFQHPGTRGAVDDGYLAAVEFHEGVVDAHAVEGGHEVLDGGDGLASAAEGGASRGGAHITGQGLLGDDVGAVGAAEGDAEVFEGRFHGDGHRPARVQSGACHSEFFIDGVLKIHA